MLQEGTPAPDFELESDEGTSVRLSELQGKPVVLYFYPKDDTPGCTKESCDFQASLPTYKRRKAAVLGVSILDEKSKAKFAEKYSLTFPLLADPDHEVIEKYGAWQEKSNYGKTYMGVARTTYLIGGDGNVVRRWDSVKVDGHAEAVLDAIREAFGLAPDAEVTTEANPESVDPAALLFALWAAAAPAQEMSNSDKAALRRNWAFVEADARTLLAFENPPASVPLVETRPLGRPRSTR